MSKKMLKRSLALGALMAFVITGSAWAAENVVNNATGGSAIAIGGNAYAKDNSPTDSAVAIGALSKAAGAESVAIGRESLANGQESVAVGNVSKATGFEAIAVGYNSNASGSTSIAIGAGKDVTTDAYGKHSIAMGYDATSGSASGANGTIAIGQSAKATSDGAVAIGRSSNASSNSSVAFGASSQASGVRSVAVGYQAIASGLGDVAIGVNSATKGAESTTSHTIGGEVYNFAGNANDGILSAASIGGTTDSSTMGASDGNPKNIYRQLQYVAAGQVNKDSTDAVNGSQLYAAYQGIDKLAADKADRTYVDDELAKKANAADVYTKEEADAEFLTQEEADARYVRISTSTDDSGNTTTETKISDNFVVEDTKDEETGDVSTKVTINEGKDAQLVVGGGEQNDKIVFGQHSSWYSNQQGFFFGGGDDVHNDATANAYIKEDGSIMGAEGKFKVEAGTGNVTAGTYNGVEIEANADGDAIINDVNINQLTAQSGNNADAINGLNQRLGKLSGKLNKVGAGAAALAALHPLEYDPDDKLTFSAGMGNYAGENAAALGAFYRPNEKFMVSLGGTMGNGENMVNLGLSIGLDKPNGLAKLSKRELIQKVNAVEAENDALEDRVAKLEALVAQLASK